MGLLDKLFNRNKSKVSKEVLEEANVCPNCWGRQEYQDKYNDYIKDMTKSNIGHDKLNQKAFIAQFVETHVSGIKLKNEICPACNYKKG